MRSRSSSATAGARLTSRLAVRFAIFFELFVGAAALSAAVQALAPTAHVIRAADAWRDADQDLLQDEFLHYCVTTARQTYWLHQAPPCRTFTRSRRSDKWGKARQLRSDEKPEGFGTPETEQANELARRTAFLARCAMESGGYFSIENPWESGIWDMPFMKALGKLEGVRFVRGDACMSGSLHKKPTGFLASCPWITDVVCDMATRPHTHVPLEGLVTDYQPGSSEDTVWYTSLAAKYTEGMCNKLARDLQEHVRAHGCLRPRVASSRQSRPSDPLLADLERRERIFSVAQPKLGGKVQLLTKKQVTKRENAECHESRCSAARELSVLSVRRNLQPQQQLFLRRQPPTQTPKSRGVSRRASRRSSSPGRTWWRSSGQTWWSTSSVACSRARSRATSRRAW